MFLKKNFFNNKVCLAPLSISKHEFIYYLSKQAHRFKKFTQSLKAALLLNLRVH